MFVEQFLAWFWEILDLPAILLVVMIGLMVYVLHRIQANPQNDFDFADMFRDENGKPSAGRMMILVCGAVSSWGIMYMLVHDQDSKLDPIFFLGYIGFWSGSAVAVKWLETTRSFPPLARDNTRVEPSPEQTPDPKTEETQTGN